MLASTYVPSAVIIAPGPPAGNRSKVFITEQHPGHQERSVYGP
jgi:hypothetical protein